MNNIAQVEKVMQRSAMRELTDAEISTISGGHPVLIVAAAVAAGFGALNAAESFGEKIGKAIYYATH